MTSREECKRTDMTEIIDYTIMRQQTMGGYHTMIAYAAAITLHALVVSIDECAPPYLVMQAVDPVYHRKKVAALVF